jgi:hypothetical protein
MGGAGGEKIARDIDVQKEKEECVYGREKHLAALERRLRPILWFAQDYIIAKCAGGRTGKYCAPAAHLVPACRELLVY